MNNLKAIIIDDEPLAHRIIERYAVDLPFLEIVGQFYFATDSYEILDNQEIDLIFLDIQMPKLKGLDFLRTLRNPPKIIITTAFEEYAVEGFELQVADYLLKPFSFDRFLKAVNVVRDALAKKPLTHKKATKLFIKVDKKQVQLASDQIQCLESYGNYVKIWLEDDMLLTPRTLNSFDVELAGLNFHRIHKSFIINRDMIDFVEGNSIRLRNQMVIPIGKHYKQSVRNWFE